MCASLMNLLIKREILRKLVDTRLGDNYSIDSINKLFIVSLTFCINYFSLRQDLPLFHWQMTHLRKTCTN